MENKDKDVLICEYLGIREKLTSRLMRDGFGQFVFEQGQAHKAQRCDSITPETANHSLTQGDAIKSEKKIFKFQFMFQCFTKLF